MRNEDIKKNLIVNLTFEFSIDILNYCELLESKRKYILSNQLLRSGTSIGANVWEAQNAESRMDFIHKFKIAGKEMEETKYWLLLCNNFKSCPDPSLIIEKLDVIHKIITRIISTSKKKKLTKVVTTLTN